MHGGARNGAGRPKGAVSKITEEAIEQAREGGEMPLAFLLRIMRDEAADEAKRIDCAKAAAPFLHARLNAIDLTGGEGSVADSVKGALSWKPQQ